MNASEKPSAAMDLRRFDYERGTQPMNINGRLRPAYEWCEMFGHDPSPDESFCVRCGGRRAAA